MHIVWNTTFGCKDIGNRKSDLVAKTQFLLMICLSSVLFPDCGVTSCHDGLKDVSGVISLKSILFKSIKS